MKKIVSYKITAAKPLTVLLFFGILLISKASLGQGLFSGRSSSDVVNYQKLADEPYGLNSLWLHFEPIVADVFLTNFTLCYGGRIDFIASDKLSFRLMYKGAWHRNFDLARGGAINNAVIRYENQDWNIENDYRVFGNLEIGGTYNIKDEELKGFSQIVLASKKRERVMYNNVGKIDVDSKIRRVIGGRLGFFAITTTTDISSAMLLQKQENINAALENAQGKSEIKLDLTENTTKLYSSMRMFGTYIGGQYSLIRNVSVKADRYGDLANNIILDTYADFLIAPLVDVDPITAGLPGTSHEIFIDPNNQVNVWNWGWRIGMDIRYNQDFFWSFGGEFGQRPSLQGRSMYFLAKLALPVFSFKLKHLRTSVDTGAMEL